MRRGIDLSGAVCDESPEVDAARERAAAAALDTLDHLIEIADMVTMQAAQRLIGVNVLRREALADAARCGQVLTDVVERSVRLEIAAALRITESEAGAMLALGEALVDRYPTVLASFSRARVTERHAQFLVEAVETVEPAFRAQILPAAIELAESQPVGVFRRRLRALIETVRATTLTERFHEAIKRRRLVLQPDHDAMTWVMTWVMTLMPAVEGQAIWDRATRIAKVILAQEGETRTLDQIRADVIADLLIEGDTELHPAEARGIRATVAVTVPVLALLDGVPDGTEPAVEGVGPIPVERARELAGGAEGWMRVLTHPESGMVLSVGRPIPTTTWPSAAGQVASRPVHGTRMWNAGFSVRNRPSPRLGTRRRDQTREPESFSARTTTSSSTTAGGPFETSRGLRRRRMDLSHRPALRRSARATSTRVPNTPRWRPAALLTREPPTAPTGARPCRRA